ncbi:hypothetical protein R69608_07035 [Paraburkholderia nemoris]|uniref:helicase C-terminal domain-containing protein n=1 Tax=Paraburkholderia nemoris TaxID=2793076 RepID=UPI0019142B0A|nr:helicase C-terminal domain-containing protein [Paraburkholderia nemoris]CAE6967690.1 hypothetical protein R69608_07035 [Paraburkholderia nemoris]
MPLSYKEEMSLTQWVLDALRLRLTGKDSHRLHEGGMESEIDPAQTCLIGALAAAPDPTFHGPQRPRAMGMVLMVEPGRNSTVEFSIQGRFDISHRYIPTLELMERSLNVVDGRAKDTQKIPEFFKRFTVSFEDIHLRLDAAKLNAWQEVELTEVMQDAVNKWSEDVRIFRQCAVNERGFLDASVPWHDGALKTDEDLARHVSKILFQSHTILRHDVRVRARLRLAPPSFVDAPSRYLLEVYLQNCTEAFEGTAHGLRRPFLMDTYFDITLIEGTQLPVPHRLQPEDYRYGPEDGVPGYGVTCAVESPEPGRFCTNSMPTFAQSRIDAPTANEVAMPHAPSFSALATDPVSVLEGFVEALKRYEFTWDEVEGALSRDGKNAELLAVRKDRQEYTREVARIADGLLLLKQDVDLRQCFAWMNEAMGVAIQLQRKKFGGWHLFQLGFLLTQVRAVYERCAPPEFDHGAADTVDVLWFATGGGKTEAYLGIIAFAMLYSRMKGRVYGTSAWMRFPLRMLSVQQFQRLSYVVAQAEILRCRVGLTGHPFTVGYFTGNGTPSNISRPDGAGASVWLPDLTREQMRSYQFIADCPYCGEIDSIDMQRDYARARLLHHCRNDGCWTNTVAARGRYGEGIRREIGIYVSDEECYRYLPTVLVGTVDKLAVIAHNERFAGFFGAYRHFCPEHGFGREAKCRHRRIKQGIRNNYESFECGNNSRTSQTRTVQLPAMMDPGFSFLIQDELHLLRESLGNFDAHYETLLQALQKAHGGLPAKTLAATATIKDFQSHLHNLYLKRGVRFPAPGARRGESFYARVAIDDDGPLIRRWFSGILPLGYGRGESERATAEVATRFLDLVDEMRAVLGKPAESGQQVCGFPSSRAPQLLAYIEKYLNTDLVYANQKRQITGIVEHLDSTHLMRGLERNHKVLDGQTPLEAILAAIRLVETKGPDDPTRHLIATSVVSHGVDIAELNFMVLDGWPRSTADYIQSSARSGRVHPGIVISVLNSSKLFEAGVFLNFGDYHFFLEKLVDSVPINRFAPHILQRTLPGVFAAVVLNWASHQNGWGESLDRSARKFSEALNVQNGLAKNAIRTELLAALSVPAALSVLFDERVLSEFKDKLESEVDRALYRFQNLSASQAEADIGTALASIFQFGPMRSFRDIENQIRVLPAGPREAEVLAALGK